MKKESMVLATDLDGTFLAGKSIFRQQLYQIIRKRNDIILIFVTGRGLESVMPLLNDPVIPNPHYIIADVGATIVSGTTLAPIEPLQHEIEKYWPGQIKILEAVKDLKGLIHQEVPQQRRCSFFAGDESVVAEVKTRVMSMNCEVTYSAGKFLDVLLKGVTKGSTLQKLVNFLNVDSDSVMVAGDTLNDLSMYEYGYRSVVVGNSEKELVTQLRNRSFVFIATNSGAGGILEAMHHFGFMKGPGNAIQASHPLEAGTDAAQLIMMYHRLPYDRRKKINGAIHRVPPKSPNGIIPTLQSFFSSGRPGIWIAWEEVEEAGEILRDVYIDQKKYPNLLASRIGLTKEEIAIFYKAFAKESFWPTIFSFVERVNFNHDHWNDYVTINRRFAERAARESDHGAFIWIHDYNLWLVPGYLRQMRPDLKIAFFHHTAFPAANTFNVLPWRREIIASLLQCDFIGFHIPRYVENFVDVVCSLFPVEEMKKVNCAPRFLTYSTAIGVSRMTTSLKVSDLTVRLGAIPVGIDMSHIDELFMKKSLREKIRKMKLEMSGKKMVLSVERLDYVKGPIEKILAFEEFLSDHPEFHGKVELVNICTPAAEGMKIYDSIKLDIEQAAGRVNGKYAEMNWTPVRVFFRSFPFEEVLVYYGAADIAWITPLRDGLNLVAKEYIAAQCKARANNRGVLILSEFAGSAVELPYAVLTNPYDRKSLKEGLLHALNMDTREKNKRMERLYEQVKYYDIDFWAEDFMFQAFGYQSGKRGFEKSAEMVVEEIAVDLN